MLQTLGRLGVQWDRRTRGMRVPRDLYGNLLSVSRLGWLWFGLAMVSPLGTRQLSAW